MHKHQNLILYVNLNERSALEIKRQDQEISMDERNLDMVGRAAYLGQTSA